jgi:hypothetical protein
LPIGTSEERSSVIFQVRRVTDGRLLSGLVRAEISARRTAQMQLSDRLHHSPAHAECLLPLSD